MRFTAKHYGYAALIGFLLVFAAGALFAQDSTAATQDKLGIFGPIADSLFPVLVTFLTSLTVKLIAAANTGFAKTPPVVKYIALYLFALAYNKLAGFLGIAAIDPLAPTLALSAMQTVAAAAVFRFGQHTVPQVPEARRI